MSNIVRSLGLAVQEEDLPAGYTPGIVQRHFDSLDGGRLLNADELELAEVDFKVGAQIELVSKSGASCVGSILGIDVTHSELMIEVPEVTPIEGGLRRVVREVRLALLTAQTSH